MKAGFVKALDRRLICEGHAGCTLPVSGAGLPKFSAKVLVNFMILVPRAKSAPFDKLQCLILNVRWLTGAWLALYLVASVPKASLKKPLSARFRESLESRHIDALAKYIKTSKDKKKERSEAYTRDLENILLDHPKDLETRALLALSTGRILVMELKSQVT